MNDVFSADLSAEGAVGGSVERDTRFAAADREASAKARRLRGRRRVLVWTGRIAFAAFIVGGWQLCTSIKVGAAGTPLVDPFFFGQPSGILRRTVELFQDGTSFGSFWGDILTTMREAVYGFLLGSATGVVMGVTLGQSRYLSDVIGPYIKIVNAIPRIVLGSIFIVAFGVGTTPKVLLSAVLVFFVVFFNAFQGVREVDRNVVSNARVLGASPLQIVRHVTVPSALTWITASLHSAFGFAIVGALVGEVLGAQRGLGLIIRTSQNKFDPNGVFACMLVIAVITLGAEYFIGLLEKRLLSWRPPAPSDVSGI